MCRTWLRYICCGWLIASSVGCDTPIPSVTPSRTVAENPKIVVPSSGPTTDVPTPLSRCGYSFGEHSTKADEAWEKFIESGRYRMARPEEFHISRRASSESVSASACGDINRDGQSYDFAAIVVDSTRDDAERFGVVVFNQSKHGEAYDGPHWLYRGADLSGVSISRYSSGPMNVRKYRDDRKVEVCEVTWDHPRKQYVCERKVMVPQ
jgi:hypothetical protein